MTLIRDIPTGSTVVYYGAGREGVLIKNASTDNAQHDPHLIVYQSGGSASWEILSNRHSGGLIKPSIKHYLLEKGYTHAYWVKPIEDAIIVTGASNIPAGVLSTLEEIQSTLLDPTQML